MSRIKALLTSRLFSLACALLILLLWIALGEIFIYAQKNYSKKQAHLDLVSYAGDLRARIESEINALLYLSSGLGGYLVVRKDHLDSGEINDIMAVLHETSRYVRNFGVAIGYQLRYVYPRTGNESAIGADYTQLPTQWPIVEQTIARGQPSLAGPVDLVQGGEGLIYRVPLFIDGHYWGLLSTVIDSDRLFTAIFTTLMSDHYDFVLYGKDGAGLEGEIIAGNPAVFEHHGAAIQRIEIPGGHWLLAVARRVSEPVAISHPLVRLFSALIGVLIAWMLYALLRDRSQLNKLAMFDALTGLPNRRLFQDRADIVFARQSRSSNPLLNLIFLDLDGFKAINDEHGHKAGDEVLRETGQRIRQSLRGCDTAARWGGDEFILILENSSVADLTAFLERLRRRIEAPIHFDGTDLFVGLSIGVARYPYQGQSLDALLQIADQAMYQNKDQRKAKSRSQAPQEWPNPVA